MSGKGWLWVVGLGLFLVTGTTLYAATVEEGGSATAGGGVVGSPNPPPATYTVASSTAQNASSYDYQCDGTNDEVQINAAINAATALTNGGSVYLSEGEFSISSSIIPKPNVDLFGSGPRSTVLNGESALSNEAIIEDTTTYSAASPLLNFSVHDMMFDGTDMNRTGYNVGRKAIFILYAKRLRIHNTYSYNTPATCIGTDYLYDGIITNNIVELCGTTGQSETSGSNGIGIGTTGDSASGYGSDEPLIIANNIAVDVENKGIMVENNGNIGQTTVIADNIAHRCKDGFGVDGFQNVTLIGNQAVANTNDGFRLKDRGGEPVSGMLVIGNIAADNAGDGIDYSGTAATSIRNIISKNIAINNTGAGIRFTGSRTDIEGNNVVNGDVEGIYVDVSIAMANVRILNNQIINNGMSTGQLDGIYVEVDSTFTLDSLEISGNRIYDTQGTKTQRYGLNLTNNGTLTNVTVKNNDFRGNKTGAVNLSSVTASDVYFFGNRGYTALNELEGALQVDAAAEVSGQMVTWDTFTAKRTTDLGWTAVNSANQACNTTCTNACVFGIDTAAIGNLLTCTDATADSCLCAGAN